MIVHMKCLLVLACVVAPALAAENAAPSAPPVVFSLAQVERLAGTDGFNPFDGNPVIKLGAKGEWDAGALGSMTVLKVGEVFHMYYEAWGVRGNNTGAPHADYASIQIGHATSRDGIHWVKDPANPVLPSGSGSDWDHKGTWDPYVLHEDGVFKMWYGGGLDGCSGLGYAVSSDGTHFQKKGRLPAPSADLNRVEDDHVVHDKASGRYFMYYWDRKHEPMGLFRAQSPNETDFDFAHAEPIRIEGLKYPAMYKFTHVFQDGDQWNMFFAEFVRPGCKGCHTGYATSSDGLQWTVKNPNILVGQDGEMLKIADDLWLMFYGPDGFFDQAGCDIRVALFKGKLTDMAH
jgi:hypothetical protein